MSLHWELDSIQPPRITPHTDTEPRIGRTLPNPCRNPASTESKMEHNSTRLHGCKHIPIPNLGGVPCRKAASTESIDGAQLYPPPRRGKLISDTDQRGVLCRKPVNPESNRRSTTPPALMAEANVRNRLAHPPIAGPVAKTSRTPATSCIIWYSSHHRRPTSP